MRLFYKYSPFFILRNSLNLRLFFCSRFIINNKNKKSDRVSMFNGKNAVNVKLQLKCHSF